MVNKLKVKKIIIQIFPRSGKDFAELNSIYQHSRIKTKMLVLLDFKYLAEG